MKKNRQLAKFYKLDSDQGLEKPVLMKGWEKKKKKSEEKIFPSLLEMTNFMFDINRLQDNSITNCTSWTHLAELNNFVIKIAK